MSQEPPLLAGEILSVEHQLVTKRWLRAKLEDGREVRLFLSWKLWRDFPRKLEGRRITAYSFNESRPDEYWVNMATISESPSQELLDTSLQYPDKPIIIVDSNEASTNPPIVTELRARCYDLQWNLRTENLQVGDYALSRYTYIERKDSYDLYKSICDGRIWEQTRELAVCENPILLIEGTIVPENERQIFGALAKLIRPSPASTEDLPPNLRVLFTQSHYQSVQLILAIVKDEQVEHKHSLAVKGKWRADTSEQKALRFLSSLPRVQVRTAKKLLKERGTPREVCATAEPDLAPITGKATAKAISEVLDYKKK